MAATTILRPDLLTRRTTAPSEADDAKPGANEDQPAAADLSCTYLFADTRAFAKRNRSVRKGEITRDYFI